jgi:nucleoside-diphosphate-sugar epimerase
MDVYQHGVDSGVGDGSALLTMAVDPIPLSENARRRVGPYPGGDSSHDNVAMEDVLDRCRCHGVVLRPGAIYGPHPSTREWTFVRRIAVGERNLPLPDGGVQLFHRVAIDRLARAVVAAAERTPDGLWACNVVDPTDWDYSGLARRIGEILGWEWDPRKVPFEAADHPWQTGHPVLGSDLRLRQALGIDADQPDPDSALRETIEWLWGHREEILAGEAASSNR